MHFRLSQEASSLSEGFRKTDDYWDVVSVRNQRPSSMGGEYVVSSVAHCVPVVCRPFLLRLLVFGFFSSIFSQSSVCFGNKT